MACNGGEDDDGDGDGDGDAAGLLASLGLPAATALTRITTGNDATVWRVETPTGLLALRLLRPGRDPGRELEGLRLGAERRLPVPQVLSTGTHKGRSVIATGWLPGRSMGELLLEGADPVPLGQLLGRAHAGLHAPAPDGSVLCHLDFHPFNVLVRGDAVSGIVDWTNARIGDPRDDVATTRVVMELAPAVVPQLEPLVAPVVASWAAGYRSVRPMPSDEVLAGHLHDAAQRQWRDWAARGSDEPKSARVTLAARAIAERHC